jgi:dipeptidyl aminopeptidase/acylaminoacyl peptidase
MKYLLLILTFFTCIVNAQEIKAKRTRQLKPGETGEYAVSGISPDGKQLLATRLNSKGLYLIDIKSGKTRTITELAGAGYEPVFSPDGRYICFRSDEFSEKKRVTSIHKLDLATGDTITIEKKGRNVSRLVSAGNSVVYLSDGHRQLKGFQDNNLKSAGNETYVLLEDLIPVLYIKGERRILQPGGEGSYIWVSLSPDKTKMLCYLTGKGAYVCDLEGKLLAKPGKINAPKWLNNQIIVGMDDKDDGDKVTSSELVAYSLKTGKSINLTSTGERNEMFPYPFPDGKRIAFRTSKGELFIMNVKVK